jgi:hypothetical protein
VLERDGTIAHELTHVASVGMLGRSPHSLLEGLAMYEEDSYLRTLGVHLTLGSIAHLYANGSFPSITVWRTRVTDWGLRNPAAVDLCYEDGQAMSAVIMQRHGGAAGIARLAKAFNACTPHHGALYSEARCARPSSAGWASRRPGGAEAHAYAAANAHRAATPVERAFCTVDAGPTVQGDRPVWCASMPAEGRAVDADPPRPSRSIRRAGTGRTSPNRTEAAGGPCGARPSASKYSGRLADYRVALVRPRVSVTAYRPTPDSRSRIGWTVRRSQDANRQRLRRNLDMTNHRSRIRPPTLLGAPPDVPYR